MPLPLDANFYERYQKGQLKVQHVGTLLLAVDTDGMLLLSLAVDSAVWGLACQVRICASGDVSAALIAPAVWCRMTVYYMLWDVSNLADTFLH